ncbi:MAG TPA: SpoIIE family protein phosphatase [Candidatus Angelobacter sp.]|nr:SpoIIE family protein phosphatase [Candidatus Angelobacter sp.]
MNDTVPVRLLQGDVVRLLLGVLVAAAGMAACLLWLLRSKRRELALFYFGIASVMYGIRLIVNSNTIAYLAPDHTLLWQRINWIITSLIVFPFILFFVETVAPQWRAAARWIVGLGGVVQALVLAGHWFNVNPSLADQLNSTVVLVLMPLLLFMLFVPPRKADRQLWIVRTGAVVFALFALYTNAVDLRLIRGNANIEYIGFVFFLCCLGYVAASQMFRNEERLVSINKELEIARRIQSGLLPEGDVRVPGLEIAAKYVPASSVAGDFYDFLICDGRGLGALVADVSGHGVPAALSASMVKIAIRSQTDRAESPAEVLSGLNSALFGNMQGQFVTAGYLFLNAANRELTYAGAGHPPLLVWRAQERRVETIEENGLFLGTFPECQYANIKTGFGPGDRCLMYTDGVLEAPNQAEEEFGMDRLRIFLAENFNLPAGHFCEALSKRIETWCNRGEKEAHDDLTIVTIDYKT